MVEDNAPFRQTLFDILSSQFPSMVIEEAADGEEAFQKIESVLPNLIFMDIKLPGENGLQLTQRIKAKHPGVIIIILTSYDLPEYREAAYQYGANYFIVKGSSTNEEILALVRSILKDSGFAADGPKEQNPS
ncbi:MAG: response regulator transcription factor [Thermodesulfobacteriota bacterium]